MQIKTMEDLFARYPRNRRFYWDDNNRIGLRRGGIVQWWRYEYPPGEYRLCGTTASPGSSYAFTILRR